MTQFEFLMALCGLLLGLALAKLMEEFADLARSRDRGRIGLLIPAAVALLPDSGFRGLDRRAASLIRRVPPL
jgi:hypothetical protein